MENSRNGLILIGGGIMRKGETIEIDQWLLSKAMTRSKPTVLFIPAASHDLPEYISDFEKRYESLGANVQSLLLTKDGCTKDLVRMAIAGNDIIYFGGGDANFLLEMFHKFDLESLCTDAINRGSTITGLSAGAIIWGKEFLNFEREGNAFVNFRIDKGLGWVEDLIVPHFDPSMMKIDAVIQLLKQYSDRNVIALGNCVSVYFEKNNGTPQFKKSVDSFSFYGSMKELLRKYELGE